MLGYNLRELTHAEGILVSLYESERFLLGEERFSKKNCVDITRPANDKFLVFQLHLSFFLEETKLTYLN